MKKLLLAIVFALGLGLVGCGSGSQGNPSTCAPCGDGAIVCTTTVAECVSEGEGTCSTTLGATGATTLTLKGDGTYTETSSNGGSIAGTWSDMGTTIVLAPTDLYGNVKAVLSVYQDGAACPYSN